MVVTVSVVRMMKVAIHKIVDVITVWHRLMAAPWPVNMLGLVRATAVFGRAAVWVLCSDSDRVVVDMISVHVMQMTIVKIVSMAIVLHGRVTTLRTVGVRMSYMFRAGLGAHG